MDVFDVYADGSAESGGGRDQVGAAADAYGEAVDVGPAGRFVVQGRRTSEQGGGKVEQECLGGRRLAGRRQPHVYRVTHRKKVTAPILVLCSGVKLDL
ncbi:hypothetical protein ACWCOV_13110 [Kribbella sp. NPDC002412]